VRHVIGCGPWNEDGSIAEIDPSDGGIAVRTASGAMQAIACDLAFLQL
jgi:hypothetical protein